MRDDDKTKLKNGAGACIFKKLPAFGRACRETFLVLLALLLHSQAEQASGNPTMGLEARSCDADTLLQTVSSLSSLFGVRPGGQFLVTKGGEIYKLLYRPTEAA